MRRVRATNREQTKRRLAGWLALFALAVQLTLSFGHIHAEDFAPPSVSSVAAPSDGAPAAPGVPDHDDCPICSVMHLAGTLLVPMPPQVAVPVAHVFIWRTPAEHAVVLRTARQPFQARAPPHA